MRKVFAIVLTLAFLVSACKTPTASQPSAVSAEARVVFWGDPAALAAEDVLEVMNFNAASAPWRRAMSDMVGQGTAIDVFVDCVDGRISAEQQFYARLVRDGYAIPPHLEIGSLAGEVTPEILKYLKYLVDSGWIKIRSINISTHTCSQSVCGAQGVKAELEAGKPLSEFQTHNVGEAAEWIGQNVTSSHPVDQLGANVAKTYNFFNGEYPVFGWIADQGNQSRELAAELHSGASDDFAIRDQLVQLNAESAEVLAPLAKAQGLDTSQSFRRIVVSDYYGPVEGLLKIQEGLDEAFNVSVLIAPNFTDAEVANVIAAARAATQYALKHAGSETELILAFQDEVLMRQFLEALEPLEVYKSFLANTSFQEVVAYKLTPSGDIRDSLLIKPAHTNASLVLGPTFRGDVSITATTTMDGVQWGLIRGDPELGGTWVTINPDHTYRFARTEPVYADAQFFFETNKAQAQIPGSGVNPDQFKLERWGFGGVVYSPDMGEEALVYLMRTGSWWEFPQLMRSFEADLVYMYGAGFGAIDLGADDIVVRDGVALTPDWSRTSTLTGEALKTRFPTAADYAAFVRQQVGGIFGEEVLYFPELGPYPPTWGPLPSGFYEIPAARFMSEDSLAGFQRALDGLKSSDPLVVAEARNTMRAYGAVQVDGVWVIGGEGSYLASGPIRFSTLTTRGFNGARSFVGFQTEFGVFGFQRLENIPGSFGNWNFYAPRLSTWATRYGPQLSKVAEFANVAMVAIMVGVAANDTHQFATQTGAMVIWPDEAQMYNPNPSASDVWAPPEKWVWITTDVEIPQTWLQSGCNGTGLSVTDPCGAYLPTNVEVPLYVTGTLAGTTLSHPSLFDYGLEGNRVSASWTYERHPDGTYTVRWNGQTVLPGETLDIWEMTISTMGMYWVPFHVEHQTAACPGLCIQQATGGERLLFRDGAQVEQVEFCPEPQTPGVCWRP